MNFLCWDTCTEDTSITLYLNSQLVTSRTCPRSEKGGPASFLIPLIRDICREAHCSLQDLQALGVTQGPGSLTGIRVGLSAAYGLQTALSIPLVGSTLFDLFVTEGQRLFPGKPLWIFVDTYGTSWAVQPYDASRTPLVPPFLLTREELEHHLKNPHHAIQDAVLLRWNPKSSLKFFQDINQRNLNISQVLATNILHTDIFLRKNDNVTPFYVHPSVPPTQAYS